jgi:hypothetical protein
VAPARRSRSLAAAVALALAHAAAADGPAPRVLADFEGTEPDRGAAIARLPSTADARRVASGQGHALEVSGAQVPPGMTGVRITLGEAKGARPPSADASRHDYLTFRIRATAGRSRLQVKLADAAGAPRDEAVDVGEITRFLPQGLSTEWQQVAIPLGGLAVNRKALAALVVMVTDPGEFSFAIDDVAVKRDPEDALPPPRRPGGVP